MGFGESTLKPLTLQKSGHWEKKKASPAELLHNMSVKNNHLAYFFCK